MSCPTNDTLEQMALGFLGDPEPVRAHVAKCGACANALEALGADHTALIAAAKEVPVPQVPKPAPRPRRVSSASGSPWKLLAGVAACLIVVVGVLSVTSVSISRASYSPPPVATAARPAAKQPYYESGHKVWNDSRDEFRRATPSASPVPEPIIARDPAPRKPSPPPTVAPPAPKPVVKRPAMSPKPKPVTPAPAPTLTLKAEPKPEEPAPRNPEGPAAHEEPGGMFFSHTRINPAVDTTRETKSTFALDVDTASYSLMRSYLKRNARPPKESVRVEEYLNSFTYQDAPPDRGNFAIRLEVGPSPFRPNHHLLRVAVLAKEVSEEERKPVNLTFVIDISGSMSQGNRLGLVKQSLHLLTNQLREGDRIGIVVYGSTAERVLELVPLDAKREIMAAIDGLRTKGSTNAEAGLKMGYAMAAAGFDPKATNRVVLCSDGVANVGRTGPTEILKTIEKEAGKGITLSTLGFGMGNFNDALMEQLADKGDGNYAYIDTYLEAKKIFTQKLAGMLEVVGFDSKVQVEFDADTVKTFRLVGYENRHVANKDFRNDKVDAGEIGSGHRVTAFYELVLRKGQQGRLATVRLRYREPDTKEQVEPMETIEVRRIPGDLSSTSPSFRLAASVMQFAEILRQSPLSKGVTLGAVAEVARPAVRDMDDPEDAQEFLELLEKASRLPE